MDDTKKYDDDSQSRRHRTQDQNESHMKTDVIHAEQNKEVDLECVQD